MSFRDCINRAVAGGEMDRARAERILREYDGVFASMRQNMGHTNADAQAARYVVQQAKKAAALKRRRSQLQASASANLVGRMLSHRDWRGRLSPGDFLEDVIANKRIGGTLEALRGAVTAQLKAPLREMMQTFRADLLGRRRNREILDEIPRAAFGEKVSPAAQRMYEAFAEAAETARMRFNRAGGDVGKLDNWRLPQAHDSGRVRKVDFQTWRNFILPLLDLDAMGRAWNDGVPFTPETIETILHDSYQAIRSNGASRREPSGQIRGRSMANSRSDPRFFQFRDAASWSAYSERFGKGEDVFRLMMGHLDSMASDIAMMETFGPNPALGFRHLQDAAMVLAQRSPDPDGRALDKITRKTAQSSNMFDMASGRANVPPSVRLATFGSATRNLMTSAMLGSAIFSAVTDFNYGQAAAALAGMSRTAPIRMMARMIASRELRAQAHEAGLIFENGMNIGNAAARYELEEIHQEIPRRFADFTIRASGLGYMTELQRQTFGMSFMSTAARDWRGRAWGDLPANTRSMFELYRISPGEWDAIRSAAVFDADGVPLLRPQEIEAVAGQVVADKWHGAMTSMIDYAVPSADQYSRALWLGNTRPGTVAGEAVRFGLQFKAFPLTQIVTHIGRIGFEAMQGRWGNVISHGASMLLVNTLLGGLAIQLKDLSKGRDPRDMTTPEFWGAAFLQGGALGIFGDYLFADTSRYGSSLIASLAGPGAGALEDVYKYGKAIARDGTDEIAPGAVSLMRRYTPGGSLWYARLLYEREITDQITAALDPEASRRFRARERSVQQYGTQHYAPPGKSIILGGARAPDFSNVLGDGR